MGAVAATIDRVREQVRRMSAREAVERVKDGFAEHDLLTNASALAYQLFYATIPMFLFGLGLAGGVGLEEAWTRDVAPTVQKSVSAPAFAVIDDTVDQVLKERQVFWMTAGAVLAVWGMSGGMRGLMGVLDSVYGCRRERSFVQRFGVSFGLAIAVGALLILTVALCVAGPRLAGDGAMGVAVGVLRWPVAAALLFAVVWLIVRYAPSDRQPLGMVTFGSILVVVAWLGTSLVFGWYLTALADYGSVFGALATVVITLSYLYVAAIAFLTGTLVDAILRG